MTALALVTVALVTVALATVVMVTVALVTVRAGGWVDCARLCVDGGRTTKGWARGRYVCVHICPCHVDSSLWRLVLTRDLA